MRFLTLLLLLPFFSTAQQFAISGKIANLHDNAKVCLLDANNLTDTLAKATAKQGVFALKGTLKEPMLVTFRLGDKAVVNTFLDNAVMKMTGDMNAPADINITGSKTYSDFKAFQKQFEPLFQQLSSINREMQGGNKSDELIKKQEDLGSSIQKNIDDYVKKFYSSPVSAFLIAITVQLTDNIFTTEARFNQLTPDVRKGIYGSYVAQLVADGKIGAVGSQAIEFSQADTSGKQVSLSSFRGKYVLLDFWASWCRPCRMENPNVVTNYNKFKEKNFTVLGISLDRPNQKDKWIEAIKTDQLTWTHVSDLQFWNNAVAQQYRISSIPQNLLIDPNGKIIAKNLRGEELGAKLCEVLGCN